MTYKLTTYKTLRGKKRILEIPKKKSTEAIVYLDEKPSFYVDCFDLQTESNVIMNSLVLCQQRSITEVVKETIPKLPKKVAIIFRNYQTKYDEDSILKIKRDCQKQGRKFFLSNNLKLAKKLDLDGAYFSSFNNNLNFNKNNFKKKFIIIGSAHSIKEIKIKNSVLNLCFSIKCFVFFFHFFVFF